ncbi:MAG: helix-turn-helix domain-containing protein [SAR324 cluster bacterium]|nr:helix-turn-helix domain-containing protein [SAR324 cluster bacterium]
MSDSNNQSEEDILKIELAIELDKGRSVSEVAENFGVTTAFVRAVKKNCGDEYPKINKIKTRRFSEDEQTLLVERIQNGESLEDIAAEAEITESTVRRWCKKRGVSVPRNIEQISLTEQNEIRELMEGQDLSEIAQAYNISRDAFKELQEPLHSMLDVEKLSYLFELLRERPRASDRILCKIAKRGGLEIPETAVGSYRKRLKMLDLI